MASTIKVDNVQNQPGTNIVSKCGTDVTLGASGDTVALASGASQTGFGRTGTVDWDTSIKTGTVTAVTGKGYFVDTTSGGITVNLPAAAVGSIVAVSDYASTSASNNITISPNGSEKINAVNDDYIMSTAGLAVTLVYADATRGWKSVTGSDADATGEVDTYIAASGGNQPTAGGCIVDTNYKVHKFTGPGTFTVTAGSGPIAVADYVVIAGGGGGGAYGGGAGAGGYRESHCATTSGPYTASPLAAPNTPASGSLAITLAAGPLAVAAGGGGAGSLAVPSPAGGTTGTNSSFGGITSAGGGGGGSGPTSGLAGKDGGSGGAGGPGVSSGGGAAGSGNTPPVSPPQGNDAGLSDHHPGAYQLGAGGGGAGAVGNNPPSPGSPSATSGGPGGAGVTTNISASPVAYAGGGGGGSDNPPRPGGAASPCGTGGAGGPGSGGGVAGSPGTINTGGGGGGGGGVGASPATTVGGNGGSGIVWIRYRFQ